MKYIYFGIFVLYLSSSLSAHQRIAILAYGSLVKRPTHSITGALLHAGVFTPTSFSFPVAISLLKNTNRITAVIDTKSGSLKRVWSATSHYENLDAAIQNLAAREGAQFLNDIQKYDTQHIFYIQKQEKQKDTVASIFDGWIAHNASDDLQKLSPTVLETMIEWAQKNAYDAAIWVSCPIISMKQSELITLLLKDPTLFKNAQMYINLLPDGPQTPLEKAIVGGKSALIKLMQGEK